MFGHNMFIFGQTMWNTNASLGYFVSYPSSYALKGEVVTAAVLSIYRKFSAMFL